MSIIRMSSVEVFTRFALAFVFFAALLPGVLFVRSADAQPQPEEESSKTHDYHFFDRGEVYLKGGRRLEGRVALRSPAGTPYLLYRADRTPPERLPISDIKSFTHGGRRVVNHGVLSRGGLGRTDIKERLLECRVNGQIDLYAPLGASEASYPYSYFSKEGAPIRKVNYANLRSALAGDAESTALISASRKWGWMKNGLRVGGAVAGLYGITQPSNLERSPVKINPMILTGAGMFLLSAVPQLLERVNFRDAISAYNN